jgi:hypothetical protein
MKSPVGGIIILCFALRTHGKNRHSRIRPVVRDSPGDTIPGTAVRTIYERVLITPVLPIKKLFQTIIADRYVGGDMRKSAFINALDNSKVVVSGVRKFFCFD